MSLRILKYDLSTKSFVSLQKLDFFKEFSIFKAFQGFSALQDVLSFKDLQGVKESKGFQELKEFKEFKEFREFLSCLSFISYYKDFRLLLCSSCNVALNPTQFKGHFTKHFLDTKGKTKDKLVLKVTSILQELEASSLSLSLDLINAFSITNALFPFQELEISYNLLKCSYCTYIVLNKKNLQRHAREEHQNQELDFNNTALFNSYIVISKGQSLERNKYCFQVENRVKGKQTLVEEEEGEEEEEDFTKQAFLKDFLEKKDTLLQSLNTFQIQQDEPLSPLDKKLKYVLYLNKKNLKSLSSQSSLCKEREEPLLNILVLNLKGLLYISLERSYYLNELSLQSLNSFQANVIRNKGFKPLLRASSRVKYFNLFSCFLAFVYRSVLDSSYKQLFFLSRNALALVKDLHKLASLAKEESEVSKRDLNKEFKLHKKSLNLKFNNFTLDTFLEKRDLVEEEELEDLENSSTILESLNSTSTSSSVASASLEEDAFITKDTLESNSNNILSTIAQIRGFNQDKTSVQIKGKLLALLLLFYKQEISLNLFDSPINAFFACKSIKDSSLTLRSSLDLTQFYSAFLYCTQLCVIQFSIQEAIVEQDAKVIAFKIKDFMSTYFNNTCLYPLATILNNNAYCKQINLQLSASSNIVIEPFQHETLTYNKVTISKSELGKVYKELITSSNQFLREKLLFDIPLQSIRDLSLQSFSQFEDLSNRTPYTCFKDYHPQIQYYNTFLINKVFSTASLRHKFFTKASNKLVLKKTEVKLYLNQIKEFLRYSLLLIHFTTGLPLRGSELITFQFLNSPKSKRELILDKSTCLFILNITFKAKGNQENLNKSNIRYLCTSVSLIFFYYIVLVLPFKEFLIISTTPSITLPSSSSIISLSPYFFNINKSFLTSKDLSMRMSTFTNLVIGKKLNIQVYRHLVLGFIKFFMLEEVDEVSLTLLDKSLEPSSFTSVIASQINHSLNVEELTYARNITTLSNIKGSTQLKYLNFCLRFFQFFNIASLNLDSIALASALVLEDSIRKENLNSLNNAFALAYSKSLPLQEEKGISNSSSIALPFRKHLRNASSISKVLQDNRPLKKTKLLDLQSISSSTTSSKVLLSLLQDFLCDKDALFTCKEQELLIRSVLLKIPYILSVLATNKGKTLSYFLTAALATSNITVVVLPLVGLKQDVLRRAKEYNVPCCIYEDSNNFLNLTLVSIETVLLNTRFNHSLTRLISSNKIDRIIIDECHLVITSSNYRSIMFRVKELISLQVQFVFLSGTVPLYIEQALRDVFHFEELAIIRGITMRENIVYKSKQYSSNIEDQQFLEIQDYVAKAFACFLTSKDKVLIFAPSIKKIKDLSEFLNCPCYYSTLEDKEDVLDQFMTNQGDFYKVLVSSSSLEEGIDYPCIRFVIYVDFVYSFIGFLQGSSRGGRDNKESTSMFFYLKQDQKEQDIESLNIDKRTIQDYIQERVCKRRIISLFLDNIVIDKCLNNVSKCDLCLTRGGIQKTTLFNLLDSNKAIQKRRDSFKSLIVELNTCCVFCYFLQPTSISYTMHKAIDCVKYYSSLSKEIYNITQSKRNTVKSLSKDSCCFNCYLPTITCSSLKEENSTCCSFLIMSFFAALCISYYKELGLKEELKVGSFNYKFNYYSLLKVFFNPVFLKGLDTESIRGVELLRLVITKKSRSQ